MVRRNIGKDETGGMMKTFHLVEHLLKDVKGVVKCGEVGMKAL